ncbi:MAG: CHAD domain-containing protein [bacterium]
MSFASMPSPSPAGRVVVTRALFETADVQSVRDLLLAEADRRELTVDEAGPDLFVETFLDTRDWRVHRAGTYLVHRDFGAASEIGWGSLRGGAGDPPLFGTSVALPTASPHLPEDCPEPLQGALRALAGRRPFRPALELDVRREELVVKRAGNWLGTVILVHAVATRRSPVAGVRLSRVEVRAAVDAAGSADPIFSALRDRAGLAPVTTSTYEAALLAAAMPLPGRPEVGPLDVHLGITSAELAFAVLRRQFREIVRREPGARLGLDPEELHKLRVAVRRLRAALRLWRWCLGPVARELQREWSVLGRALGAPRDLDVELESLDAWSQRLSPAERVAFAPVEAWVTALREEARMRMLVAMDARHQERLARGTSRWLREGRALPLEGRRPARREVGRLVRRRYRALREHGRNIAEDSPAAELHRVRILAKHLRYCLEFHAELLGPDARRMVHCLVQLQDALGEYQDLQVSLDRLRPLGQDSSAPLAAGSLAVLDRLREERRLRALELRRGFAEAFARIRGPAWKQLKGELGSWS